MAKKIIQVMDTTYRDGFQSAFGGRVLLNDFLPTIEAAKHAGIRHFEAGGGARFQTLFFYLNENAFDMMDAFRDAVGPDIKLQTLARGVNYVGLDTGSREILDLHGKMFKKHGMTTIRNFDALNDVRNLEYSAQAIKNAGLNHEMTLTVMDLPPGCSGAHDAAFYEKTLRSYLDAGIPYDSFVIKDASGTASPSKIHETVQMARKLLGDECHMRFHTHETAGIGAMTYKAAIEAGIDGIDLSREPVSGGTCQPDFLVMMHALKGTDFTLGNDLGEEFELEKILESESVLKEALSDYFIPPEATQVSAMIQFSPMPGGALTANTQMLRDNNILDKFPDVIKEMREVVEKGGYGTSVTPVSQFYFQQAFNNVMFGKWKRIADGYGKMVLGYFGKTPTTPDADVIKLASEQLKLDSTTETAIDIADRDEKKSIAYATKMLQDENLAVTDENLFIALSCAEKGIAFLKGEAKVNVRKISEIEAAKPSTSSAEDFAVTVDGKAYNVNMKNGTTAVTVDSKTYNIDVAEGKADTSAAPKATAGGNEVHIHAPLPGNLFKLHVKLGQQVDDGEEVLIMEAMKMETPIQSPCNGTITSIDVAPGDTIESGQILIGITE
jgi:pyruvate carboxylase subunit B